MMDSTILQRNARPIRHEVATHLFTMGQIVRLKNGFALQPRSAAIYRITATLPPRGDSFQYRIRNDDEVYERVATQDSLERAGGEGALVEATSGQVTETHQSRDQKAEVEKDWVAADRPGMMKGLRMNADGNETELGRRALAICVWENEGGAQASSQPDDQFGRRVEMDHSWTIYHVFTGVPARFDGVPLTNLSGSAATDGMLSLNRRNVKRQKERNAKP
jgi:hypothetical protein